MVELKSKREMEIMKEACKLANLTQKEVEKHIKPGISTILTTAKIVSELGKNGFPTGPNEDGSTNMFNQYTKIMVDNIFTELKDNMQVQVSLPYGAVPIIGFGANGGGAVTVHGFNNVAITAAGSEN